jgi:hypothetical protein
MTIANTEGVKLRLHELMIRVNAVPTTNGRKKPDDNGKETIDGNGIVRGLSG